VLTDGPSSLKLDRMSTVVEIESVLPKLTTKELRRAEEAVRQQYRQRKDGIVYDDSYGVVTETDLIASAEQAFLAYEKEEQGNAQRQAR
jgi:hypothetical protein